jgi:hypothetical protein
VRLDDIVDQLNERKQRATYGAVATFVGGAPIGLMRGRERCHKYSWVVAKKTGRPTGYAESQIDPDCRGQIGQRPGDIIEDGDSLKKWLQGRAG